VLLSTREANLTGRYWAQYLSEAQGVTRIRALPHRDPRPLACPAMPTKGTSTRSTLRANAPQNDGDGASLCVDAMFICGTKSLEANRLWFRGITRGAGTSGGKTTQWVYRRGLKLEGTYASMNVGDPSIRPRRGAGLPAVDVMLGCRRNHSSPRTVTPSTGRRVPVIRT
jgi:hypothetical protein